MGKSTIIINDFKNENNNKKYCYNYYFPLGGEIKRKEIIDRLLILNNKNIALDLDLFEIKISK